MKLVWTQTAQADLRGIRDYIARDSRYYASRYVSRLVTSVERLSSNPFLGAVVPEQDDPDIREMLYRNHRIFYKAEPERVAILSVVHAARDIGGMSPAPWQPK